MSSSDLNLPELSQGGQVQTQAAEEQPHEDGSDKLAADLRPVFDVPVSVQAVIGRTTVEVSKLLQMGPGSVLELDRRVGEAIDIYVNSRLVARGEVVVVDDRLGVTMTEIIKNSDA
ncbi:MAG: flagellar motor switch protein FliN [Alphaproteobacteria bacterium]|nr:flagellar motor switch protein FliN [Alphaproteobacteria bacterium]